MSTNPLLSLNPITEDPVHWRKVFGDSTLSLDGDDVLQQLDRTDGITESDRPCDTLLVYRFDDDCSAATCGHRTLFSAREEDEHPDLVFTDE
ncbi:MAG: hypothetical protein ABIZ04_14545 [Opitutus sp.]